MLACWFAGLFNKYLKIINFILNQRTEKKQVIMIKFYSFLSLNKTIQEILKLLQLYALFVLLL